ncbi:MAG: glycosyltransferase family 9 protein [Candidatus Cloacimonadales bacterium]|jgi:ADP-heptose:LPS heptosyltransferase|nr:glycosyltransferase family 9 protein [Candidatus Cloacimonadales bacterium]
MKVLIIQLAKMGDIIQSFQLCKAILSSSQKPEIYFLQSEIFSDTLNLLNNIKPIPVNLDLLAEQKDDQYLLKKNEYAKQIIKQLNGFDYVINLNGSALSASIMSLIDCPNKRGFASSYKNDEKWLNFIISFMKNRYLASFNLVDIFGKLNPFSHIVSAKKTQNNNAKKQVAIQLGSRNSKRHPLMSDFAKIANKLIANNYQIVLTGVQSEMPLYHDFITLIDKKEHINNMIGKTKLKDLYQILDQSQYLISSDTGTMHLAAQTSCKVFAIFLGSAYPYETLSFKTDTIVYFPNHDIIKCYPCSELSKCPFDFVCKEFDSNIISDYIIYEKQSNKLHKAIYDSLGQFIVPLIKQKPADHQLFALIWRIAAAQYFFNTKISLSDYRHYFDFDQQQLSDAKRLIEREIKIAKLTINKPIQINELNDNYYFLNPLLIYNLLWQSFDEFIDIINEIIKPIT